MISASLFVFAFGAEEQVLKNISVATLWVCALLSSTLALRDVFDHDYADGTLEQLMLTESLPEFVLIAKILASWITHSVPLLLVAPVLAQFLYINNTSEITNIIIVLALGTFAMGFLGAIGASLTLGLKRGGGLVNILVLPISIPIVIIGSVGLQHEANIIQTILMLTGIVLFMVPISIVACVYCIKVAIEEQ